MYNINNVDKVNVLFNENTGELDCVHIFCSNGADLFIGKANYLKIGTGSDEALLTERNGRLSEARQIMIDADIVKPSPLV